MVCSASKACLLRDIVTELYLTIAIFFSPALLATQCAAMTSIAKFLLTLNDCIREDFLSLLKNLSKRPSSAKFNTMKRLIGTYDGDETASVTAANSPSSMGIKNSSAPQ